MDLFSPETTADGTEGGWLVGHRFQSLTKRDYDWVLTLDNGASLAISCLWRLIEAGRICRTSPDEGQKFGLPAPVDVAKEVNRRLSGALVTSAFVRPGVLDIDLGFSTGHVFQVIPDSSGYEAWKLGKDSQQLIAVGGGDLAIFG
jgi:Family of unknown function (DUF6188)